MQDFERGGLLLAAGAAWLLAQPVQAHVPGGDLIGIGGGFAHPFSGADHLLVMLAVGVWAAQQGGRALLAIPAAFLAMMTLGFAAAAAGLALPAVEQGITGSLILIGTLIALARALPLHGGAALAGLFAVFHGYAHGVEGAQAPPYLFGLILATFALHGGGLLLGVLLRDTPLRLCGALLAAAGFWQLIAA